jgi:hypothetical protein
MLILISVILIAGNITGASVMPGCGSTDGEIGNLPELVIAEPRCDNEDIAYSSMLPQIVISAQAGPETGMLDEVVISEPRYEGEDIAYAGILPTIQITAKRLNFAEPVLTWVRQAKKRILKRTSDLVVFIRIDSRNTGYLN